LVILSLPCESSSPSTLILLGFLGLTIYYRKFVWNYGNIAAPLTSLLKHNAFTWTSAVDHAFQALKYAMCSTHVLALPDFTRTFVLQCNAFAKGTGVVLMQDGKPLAFTSKQISERHLCQSIYEKEMLSIMHVVDLWRPYLLGQRFQIKTDHQSLKYFLEHRISSPKQQKWVTKLFGYDYEIIYNKGKENVVVDGLFQKYEEEGSRFSLSFILPDCLQAVCQEWLQDPKMSSLLHQLQHNSLVSPGYSWYNEDLRYKGCLYLCKQSQVKSIVFYELHASPTSGHSGFTKTQERVKHSFSWEGMKQDVRTFVVECEVCRCNKGENVKASGTLQPVPIPPAIWRDISMDFIVGFYLNRTISRYSWCSSIASPNMLIFVLFNTHSQLPQGLDSSWIIPSSLMACLILLSLRETPLSPAIFGKSCSSYGAPNCTSALPIAPRRMARLKSSTSVWKHI
jgi:hypothetical protein